MQALILGAGRGSRMGALTEKTPKPLLTAGGRRLIEHQILALKKARIERIVINIAHLADQFPKALGDGSNYGVELHYSREPEGALETGGGIRNALPLLDDDVFVVTNADVYTDIDYSSLNLSKADLAHLVMVDNPDFHPTGDFWLADARVSDGWCIGAMRQTFSGIGVYHKDLFRHQPPGRFPLAPLLVSAMDETRVSGQHHDGIWMGIDTPDRLEALDRLIRRR